MTNIKKPSQNGSNLTNSLKIIYILYKLAENISLLYNTS